MKIYEMEVIPEEITPQHVERKLVATNCDICKEVIKGPRGHDVEEIEVYYKEGFSCQDGGAGTKTYFDICTTCFKEKLIPFITSFGSTPTEEDWDW